MPALTDEDKVIRNDVGKRIAAAIESLSAPEAEKVSYDNTESGMTADNIQDAVDELKSDIDSVELTDLDDVDLTSPQDEDELHYDSATSKWKNIAKKIYEKSASGSLVSFNDGGDNIPLKSLIANITAVQSGSGTPSPSNIRSISGWSGAKVFKTGKNLFFSKISSVTIDSSGTISITGENDVLIAPVKKDIDYRITITNTSIVYGFFENMPVLGSQSYNSARAVTNTKYFTAPINGYIAVRINAGTEISSQLELGTTGSTVEAYKGTTLTLPFGQTVYGGLLDVIKGVLTVTHEIVDLGSLTWSKGSGNLVNYMWAKIDELKKSGFSICSSYATSTSVYTSLNDKEITTNSLGISTASYIVLKNTDYASYTDVEVKTAMNGVQLVYELATPVTYQLTPAQVKTLLGLNNIFADTGDISLSYFTQNANAINDIAESNTRTALNTDVPKTDLTDIFVTGTKNNTGSTISAGTYFYVNGQLALCKQAISANADLTLNTNYELVTAGALNKLASDAITVTNGDITSNDYTGHIYWKKQGKVVVLNFYDFKISTSSVTISALLPSEIKPTGTNARGMILSVDTTEFCSIHVTTAGNFEAVVTNTSKYYYGNVTYII